MRTTDQIVSIIIITYNSSKYIIETLESAKSQTYHCIELIISDDGSSDNTLEICRIWLEKNRDRFISTKVCTVETNRGIPANCNRGVNESKGEWIKLIAGDDILLPECIALNIEHVKNNNEMFVVSDLTYFDESGSLEYSTKKEIKKFFTKPYEKQKKHYLKYPLFLNSPTFFYSKKLLVKIGLFDEDYFYIEDAPLIYKIFENNIKLSFLDKKTVFYRKHENNMTNKKTSISLVLNKDLYRVYKKYREPILGYNILCKIFTELDFFLILNNKTNNFYYPIFRKIFNKYKFSI